MPVMIGVDPHKASHTAAVLDEHGQLLDRQRVPATLMGYRALRQWAGQWQERRWAVEGAHGIGRALAQRLVGDGEQVLDVPAKLAARVRVLSVGHGRKSDPDDAVSVAVAARNAGPQGHPGAGPGRLTQSRTWATGRSSGIFNPGTFAGCVLAGRARDDQLVGPARLTVTVRWGPGLTLRCGTRMARPVRPARGPAPLPGAIGRSFIRAGDLVPAVPGLVRSSCRVCPSPRPRSRRGRPRR
jgi:Transposase